MNDHKSAMIDELHRVGIMWPDGYNFLAHDQSNGMLRFHVVPPVPSEPRQSGAFTVRFPAYQCAPGHESMEIAVWHVAWNREIVTRDEFMSIYPNGQCPGCKLCVEPYVPGRWVFLPAGSGAYIAYSDH